MGRKKAKPVMKEKERNQREAMENKPISTVIVTEKPLKKFNMQQCQEL